MIAGGGHGIKKMVPTKPVEPRQFNVSRYNIDRYKAGSSRQVLTGFSVCMPVCECVCFCVSENNESSDRCLNDTQYTAQREGGDKMKAGGVWMKGNRRR